MNKLTPMVAEFEGKPVTTFIWQGRRAWSAREIARAIGYAGNGKQLVTQMTTDWSDDLVPGHDYEMLSGSDLAAFKLINLGEMQPVAAQARRGLVILYESGLNVVLTKTDEPAGGRLRRFIVDEVLPDVAPEGGQGDPRLVVLPAGTSSEPTPSERWEARLAEREARRAGRLDLDHRSFQVATLHRTAEALRELGRLDDDQYILLEVSACEIALGFPLIQLYPPPVREAVAAALGVRSATNAEVPVATAA